MKKIYQDFENDCYPCCLAMILKKEKKEIPIFDPKNYHQEKLKWLQENNLVSITIPISPKTNRFPMLYFPKKFFCIGMLRLKYKRYGHAVILEFKRHTIDCWDFRIWHDPLGKDSPYGLDDLRFIEFVISKDFLPLK